MSDAPDRIFLPIEACKALEFRVYHDDATYIRADLAGLPEELVERLRIEHEDWSNLSLNYGVTELLRDLLAWHEATKS